MTSRLPLAGADVSDPTAPTGPRERRPVEPIERTVTDTHPHSDSSTAPGARAASRQAAPAQPAVIVIHGGAGTLLRAAMSDSAEADYRAALRAVLEAGQAILAGGGSALDAVTEAVRLLEVCPLFNAGHGAVLNEDGAHELDAAVMDGASRAAGAVAGVTRLRHPVLAARAVLQHGEHVLLAGAGAERFAMAQGCETVTNDFFGTEARRAQWRTARAASAGMLLDHDAQALAAGATTTGADVSSAAPIDPDRKFGTVGAVACDMHGHVAAATSTGGMTNKRAGRIGDSPLIGAGCYADDATCAVSATGSGEHFMRIVAAHALAARLEYTTASLDTAAREVIDDKLAAIGGRGGLIAVDARGRIAMPFNTEGMYRGHARVGEPPVTAIYRDEA